VISETTIQQAVERIVASVHPKRVILFGSYAQGERDQGSDLDLMVIEASVPDTYQEMIRLHAAVGNIGVGVDVLVYSDTEFERRSQVPGTVLYWARKEGRVLYDARY
jgi:uncharacterized protein